MKKLKAFLESLFCDGICKHKPSYHYNEVDEWLECDKCGEDVSDMKVDWTQLNSHYHGR